MRGVPLRYCLAARTAEDRDLSWCSAFDPQGTGEAIWSTLSTVGLLDSAPTTTQKTRKGEEVAAAVSSRVSVSKGESKELEFCLAWDSPKVRFGAQGKEHERFYTRHWKEEDGPVGPRMCQHALTSYQSWEEKIEAWQEPVLEDSSLPDWFKSAIFNELYYLADGGSVWLQPGPWEQLPQEDFRVKYGRGLNPRGYDSMGNISDGATWSLTSTGCTTPTMSTSTQAGRWLTSGQVFSCPCRFSKDGLQVQ